jgi:hypothetical protein
MYAHVMYFFSILKSHFKYVLKAFFEFFKSFLHFFKVIFYDF